MTKVYFCIVGILSAFVLVECTLPPEVKQQYVECAKELGLPIEEPFKVPTGDDPKKKCLNACVMIRDGSMIDGKVNAEKAIELLDKYSMEKLSDSTKATLTECAKKANEAIDKCEVVGILQKCVAEKLPMPKQQ